MSHRAIFSFLFLTLATVAYRLTLGVDFTDESYYAAMALRFISGDTLFIDELFVHQTSILPLLPFVKAYTWAFGNEGLILFLRGLYFIFSLVFLASVLVALKKGPRYAAALLAVVFIPLHIPALSYNTLGGGGLGIALFLSLAFLNDGRLWKAILAMTALAVSELAYPPLVVPGLALVGIALLRREPRSTSLVKTYLVTHAIAALAFSPYLLEAGLGLVDSFVYTTQAHHHGGGWDKTSRVVSFVFGVLTRPGALAAAGCLVAAGITKKKWPLIFFAPCLAFAFWSWNYSSTWSLMAVALLAPGIYLLGPREEKDFQLLIIVWVPSLVAGVLTGWISSSSPANLIIGLWAAAIVSVYFLGRATPSPLPATLVVILFLGSLFIGRAFYCDGTFPRLTARVSSGPFRGLATTPEKLRYLQDVARDVESLETKGGQIVFYEFPAGYLLSAMRIPVNSAWMRTESLGKMFYVRHYLARATDKDLVFKMNILDHGYLSPVSYSSEDPFLNLLGSRFDRVLERPYYEVFKAKASTQPQLTTPATSERQTSPSPSVASTSSFKHR